MRNDDSFEEIIVPLITIQNYVPSVQQTSFDMVLGETPDFDGVSTYSTKYAAHSDQIAVYLNGELKSPGIDYYRFHHEVSRKIIFEFGGTIVIQPDDIVLCDYVKEASPEVQ